jgi:hypothetical protein
MGTDKVIFVEEQWGATGSHVTGTDVTGSHVTGSCLEQHWLYLITWVDIVTSPTYSFASDKFK